MSARGSALGDHTRRFIPPDRLHHIVLLFPTATALDIPTFSSSPACRQARAKFPTARRFRTPIVTLGPSPYARAVASFRRKFLRRPAFATGRRDDSADYVINLVLPRRRPAAKISRGGAESTELGLDAGSYPFAAR